MGYDFVGSKKRYFRLNVSAWWTVYTLGVSLGWQPAGTGPPRGCRRSEWPSIYFANEGQKFYARDAKQLADILEQVISPSDVWHSSFDASRLTQWLRTPIGKWDRMTNTDTEKLFLMLGLTGPEEKRRTKKAKQMKSREKNKREQVWVLTEDGKSYLREFIKFCRAGSFRIY